MTRKKTYGKPVRISNEAKDKLKKYAMSKKIPMKIILETFVNQGVEFDIFDPNWMQSVKLVSDKANLYASLDEACPALQFVGVSFRCIWYRKDKPPMVKTLGLDLDEAESICKGCTETRKIIDTLEDYELQNRRLKDWAKDGVTATVPVCKNGGFLNEDGTKMYCQKLSGAYRTVSSCKTLRKGANCEYLRWTHIEIKGTFPEDLR